ncbi:MAG TPA: (4Fe-4S)-binding protein [Desulfotomaculum sp.]|nr:(4Fe-4S)-binding protein [Desulfotomaculum sp.]
MFIAIASGKGGTGKTTIATSLALAIKEQYQVQYIDCDVEEPNGHIFLKPELNQREPVTVEIPKINFDLCSFCGRCAEICAFHALVALPGNVLSFTELCHSCGGCMYFCPEKAISPAEQEIGWIEGGLADGIEFMQGRLKIGVAVSPPLIQAVKRKRLPGAAVIADVSPGTSCPVIKAVEGADFCILVPEPTPFGLHDLELAFEMIRELKVPGGVVINRSDGNDEDVERFCRDRGIPLLMKFPFSRDIAVNYAKGLPLLAIKPQWKKDLIDLWRKCERMGRN